MRGLHWAMALATSFVGLIGCSLLVPLDDFSSPGPLDAAADGARTAQDSAVGAADASTFCSSRPSVTACTEIPNASTPGGFTVDSMGRAALTFVENASAPSAPFVMQAAISPGVQTVRAFLQKVVDVAPEEVRLTFSYNVLEHTGRAGFAMASVFFRGNGDEGYLLNVEAKANGMLGATAYEGGGPIAEAPLVAITTGSWHTVDLRFVTGTGAIRILVDGEGPALPSAPTPTLKPVSLELSLGAYGGEDDASFVVQYDDVVLDVNPR